MFSFKHINVKFSWDTAKIKFTYDDVIQFHIFVFTIVKSLEIAIIKKVDIHILYVCIYLIFQRLHVHLPP